jgi:hypothetical protein
MDSPPIKESGQSAIVGDEFVIVTVGRSKGRVRYLVIRTWPNSSTADERVRDERFVFADMGRMVLMPSGYEPVDTAGTAYFFRDSTCETMKVEMKESSVPMLHLRPFIDSRAIWDFLKQYSRGFHDHAAQHMRQLNTIADYQALAGKRVTLAERAPSDPGHSFAGTVAGLSEDGRSLILSDVQELRYPDEDSPPSSIVPYSKLTLPLDQYEVLLVVDL